MSIKPDRWIRRMALEHDMISPFAEATSGNGIISYGVTSYGYDIRLAPEFVAYTSNRLDPKNITPHDYIKLYSDNFYELKPKGFILARSVETIKIPRNVSVTVISKSTYARVGIQLLCTPLEPEWQGTITLEIFNSSDGYVPLYVGDGIGQIQFHESDEPCETSYAEKRGKYQNQTGVTLPKVI